jgi:hypothetical protein
MFNLNVMLNLSVAVAVTVSLDTNIGKRLKWLETVLTMVDPESRQVRLNLLSPPWSSLLTWSVLLERRNSHVPCQE